MPSVHVRSISIPQARTKYLESSGTYEDSRSGTGHVRSISIPLARTKYLGRGPDTYVDSRYPCWPSRESLVPVHLRLLVVQVQVHVQVQVRVQVQVQVQVHVVALPFAFLIARVHIIWLVYCACTDQGTFLSACVNLGACACAFAGLYVVVFCTIRGFVRL